MQTNKVSLKKLQSLIAVTDAKFSLATPQQQQKVKDNFKISPQEMASFQQLKSIAQVSGLFDLETSMFIYDALNHWEKQTLGTKYILQVLHADLLKKKLKGTL
jgi:hypothetical protein